MPSLGSSRGPSSARVRGSIACRRCRQAKVRCGMSEPPCIRCTRHGFDCSFDPNFRRINNSERFEELESRLKDITKEPVRHDGEGVHSAESEAWNCELGGSMSGHGDASIGSVASELQTPSLHQTFQLQSPPATIAASDHRSLGTVQLSLDEIKSLFLVYFEHYHPYLPFLESTRTPEEYYNLSPVLFWSIIAVASRQYKEDLELLTRLSPVLSDLIWAVVKTNPISLTIVQALLLISCWPLPNFHLWTDKSFVLNNIALAASMHLGLHRPGRECEYSKLKTTITEEALMERSRTWVACVIQAQSLSMDFGFMSMAYMDDYTIHSICRSNPLINIPSELRTNLLIRRCCHSTLQTLTSHYDNPFGLPSEDEISTIISQIEQKFTTLQLDSGPDLSYINTLRLYSAKLFFQSTHLLYDTMTSSRQSGVLTAFSTATSLLTILVSHSSSQTTLSYAPPGTCHSIFLAALVIFRVIHSSYAASASLDRSAAQVLYSAAAFSVRQMSAQYKEKDMAIRVAEMMTNLWHWAEGDVELQESPPKLLVKSRIGSSVLYDSLILYRKYQVKRNPELRALQTGENLSGQERGEGRGLGSQGTASAVGLGPGVLEDESFILSSAGMLSTGEQQSGFAGGFAQDWDWFNLAWADNFGMPETYETGP